jgi:hypothetical protein
MAAGKAILNRITLPAAILPLAFLLLYPMIDPHWLAMDGVYFHDNIYHARDTWIFYLLSITSMVIVIAASKMHPSWHSESFLALSLGINGIMGLYSPFVSVAFVLGISDALIVTSMIIEAYAIGSRSQVI